MSMHLVGPALTTTGKKRGKKKFRNAAEAAKARALAADWEELQKKWGVTPTKKRKAKPEALVYKLDTPAGRTTTHHIPSRGDASGVAAAKPTQQYTGTKMLGIGTMHKSNSVPIFSDEEAVEISRMRRG